MTTSRRYPRSARVNEVLREVIADAVERESSDDDRIEMVTVTGVEAAPDLRHASVFFTALGEDVSEALNDHRAAIQARIAKEVRLKRTPQLRFLLDPSIEAGDRIEQIISTIEIPEDDDERVE